MPYALPSRNTRKGHTLHTRLVAAALLSASVLPGRAAQPAAHPEEAPRADASVREALRRGEGALDVLVGVRETAGPAGRARARDASGRLETQRRIVAEMRGGTVRLRRQYAGFPAFAARATREAVLALARRPDVAWITLDSVRYLHALQAEPQPGQILIRSAEANARGIDGTGETIAILDTGVDYRTPGLGGASFPNAKVVGGTDIADGDADPMDCAGHGTSVAAIAAGPAGVAPAARIVALKIARSASCDTAQDSDILAAMDWALAHREELGIGTLNLSFGSTPFDGQDHGFCDAEIPQYAAAVEALNAAGIVFTASAGNEAITNAVSAPACLSTALGVGAVYPRGYSSVTWADGGGGTFCADYSVVPDAIVCFSNSAPTLALLAPGAFWNVETLGGGVGEFHGTSSAAPAVAGAVALLRQARPGLAPSTVASLLRATGQPVSDARNGVLTPRLDILGAIDLPAEVFGAFEGSAVPISDGDGAAAVTVEVAGFSGNLASVAAVVQIEHDDPRQLVVTLRGPDGESVRLHDRTGSPRRPINAVYGRTLGAAQPLNGFQGQTANGMWTLEVEDAVTGIVGRIRHFAVRLTPGQPPSAIPRGVAARVLPLVGRVQGTRFFLSDARVFNPDGEAKTLSLYYVPQGASGEQAVRATRTVGPGEVLALDDLVGSEFGYSESIGQLTLTAPGGAFLATSRAYTHGEHGTFGVFVPSFDASEGIGPGETATANGLSRGPRSHTNAGFTEVSGSPVTVRMDVFSEDGRLLGSKTRGAPANGSGLVTDILGDRGLGATSNVRIDFTVESASGRVVPFATFVDDVTGDGVFAAARRVPLSEEDIVITQASHATGASSDFFATDLHVSNVSAAPASFTVSLLPRVLTGTPRGPRTFTLGPGETLEARDVLRTVFDLQDPSAAGLRIHPSSAARLRVSSRTYVQKFGGTFGFSIPGLPVSRAIGRDDGFAAVLQLDQTSAASGFRSNFGVAEVAGADAVVEVEALRGDGGGPIGARRRYTVAAGSSVQHSSMELLPSGGRNVYLKVRVVSGEGRILAYGVSIDNTSGDAIFIPAETLEP